MKVSRENLENNRVQLEVQVEKETVNRAIDQVCRNIAKEVTIPGFRRGRAPKHIVTRYVGQARLHQEALEKLLQESYEKALVEADVQPVDQPSIDIDEFEEGQEFCFKATITVKPEPQIEDYQSISVAPQIDEVTDENIQSVIDSLLDDQSVLEPAGDDEGFGEGKHAIVVLNPEDKDKPTSEEEEKEYVIEFGRDQIFPGADEQLAGAKAGEERTITHEWPQEQQEEPSEETEEEESVDNEEEQAPKEMEFKILIKGLRVKKVPELNDEFVASLELPVNTVDELRETITERLKANNEETARKAQLEKIHEELLEKAVVDIPEVMIENRMDRLMEEFTETLKRRNMDLDTYLAAVQQEKEEFRSSFRERAEGMVKLDLVLEVIARKEGMEATEEDLQQVMGSLAQGYQQSPEALKTMFQTEGFMEYLKSTVIMDKTNRFLVEKATENSASDTDTAGEEAQEVSEEDAT